MMSEISEDTQTQPDDTQIDSASTDDAGVKQKKAPSFKRSLLQGLFVVVGFYLCVAVFVFFSSDVVVEQAGLLDADKDLSLQHRDIPNPPSKKEPVKPGEEPYKVYAQKYDSGSIGDKPKIAFGLRYFGLSDDKSREFMNKAPVMTTLIASPYGDNIRMLAEAAHSKGFEIWLEAPIGGTDTRVDPGHLALLGNRSLAYNKDKLDSVMALSLPAVGIGIFYDGSFIKSKGSLKSLIDDIEKSGYAFFDMNAEQRITTSNIHENLPYTRANISNQNNFFEAIEKKAVETGFTIALLDPYYTNINAVLDWLNSLEEKGFALVPLSASLDTTE